LECRDKPLSPDSCVFSGSLWSSEASGRHGASFLQPLHPARKRMSQQVFKTKAEMVCPILALPVKIRRQVIQNLDPIAELHTLSLSCKAFTEITRKRIFAHITFMLPFPSKFCGATEWAQETRLRGLSKMVVQTKYIQTLSVLPQSPVEPNEVTFPPNMQEILAEWM